MNNKAVSKKEFCAFAGISYFIFRQWQEQHWEELKKRGQRSKKDRILTPAAAQFLAEFYCVDLDYEK